jgi:hypothetical protein
MKKTKKKKDKIGWFDTLLYDIDLEAKKREASQASKTLHKNFIPTT